MAPMVRWSRDYGKYAALVLGVTVLVLDQGWIGATTAPMAVLLFVMDERHVDDDVACRTCLHRKDDHHGNCQECLRQQVRGDLDHGVPCSRFRRPMAPPRSRSARSLDD
jgi:hypothetical protein